MPSSFQFLVGLGLLGAVACGSSDDTPPVEPPVTPPVTEPVKDECKKIVIDNIVLAGTGGFGTFYESNIATPIGGALPDGLAFQFFPSAESVGVGTADLTTTKNKNYGTCSECLLAYSDRKSEDEVGKYFFQTRGTINFTVDPYKLQLKGTVTNLQLSEVTLNPDTYASTLVADGECLEYNGAFVLNYEAWTCDTAKYGANDGCDCTCGEFDIDCYDPTSEIIGCESSQTCAVDTCVATCDVLGNVGCAGTDICVAQQAVDSVHDDYCIASDHDYLDTANIGEACDAVNETFYCDIDNGIAKGVCVPNQANDFICQQVCRLSGDDCAENASCVAFNSESSIGACVEN